MESCNVKIEQGFLTLEETCTKIALGEQLVVAADEMFLSELPSGNWIGGTIPYFMTKEGGTQSSQKAFVHTIRGGKSSKLSMYDHSNIDKIASDTPQSGFTIVILPAGSEVHSSYSEHAPNYEDMFDSPIIGWVSGVHLSSVDSSTPKTVYGSGKHLSKTNAVAMHVEIPQEQVATISIVNSFSQGTGPEIRFMETGFNIHKCIVDGKECLFSEYLKEFNIDTKLPMVADYSGTGVNVSIKNVDHDKNVVKLYAPVFKDIMYKFPDTQDDYLYAYKKSISKAEGLDRSQFSVSCVLNYLYSGLEGKKVSELTGPITFGEVAYQLLNQTSVYLTIEPSM
ncbi:MAG: hypothetical protein RPS47_04825 [Colwellia sp.]|jgi:hypothetical protein